MFESLVKTTCNIIQSIWNTNRAAVESFLLSLAANVRDCSEKVQAFEIINFQTFKLLNYIALKRVYFHLS